jgi:hypothetical protein
VLKVCRDQISLEVTGGTNPVSSHKHELEVTPVALDASRMCPTADEALGVLHPLLRLTPSGRNVARLVRATSVPGASPCTGATQVDLRDNDGSSFATLRGAAPHPRRSQASERYETLKDCPEIRVLTARGSVTAHI